MRFTIEHLAKSYEKKLVLRDIDFSFESGRIYGLLGRNGAGIFDRQRAVEVFYGHS